MAIREVFDRKTHLRGIVSRKISSGFYAAAANEAYHGASDHEEKVLLIQRAMDAALSAQNLSDAGGIAGDYGDYLSEDHRRRLSELAPTVDR